MAVDGDVTVFLSGRVGGEPPDQPQPPEINSSLMTFADMVLMFDSGQLGNNESHKPGFDPDLPDRKADHTYASCSATFRKHDSCSKAMQQQETILNKPNHNWPVGLGQSSRQRCPDQVSVNSFRDSQGIGSKQTDLSHSPQAATPAPSFVLDRTATFRHSQHLSHARQNEYRVKKSSSVEDIIPRTETQEHFAPSEWSVQQCQKSPRKSCSVEAVNCDHQDTMKASKSSENVHHPKPVKQAVSHQLHRMVNDTLEFPYWPRKADHTYATATWDGTAASHSLFEQEMREMRAGVSEEQEMEIIDQTNSCSLDNNLARSSERIDDEPMPVLLMESSKLDVISNLNSSSTQRDDHTYVKAKTSSDTNNSEESVTWTSASDKNTNSYANNFFSSATFPRQKPREDHTYFHSGLSRTRKGNSSSSVVGSTSSTEPTQSVGSDTSCHIQQGKGMILSKEDERSHNKDHNYYSTSA